MDLEMTGLDHTSEVIVEIATLITDDDLEVVAEGPDLVVHQPEELLLKMDPFVVEMHSRSGLLDQIKTSTISLEQAGAETLAFIKQHVPEARTVPLCGNSIGTDRRFLAAYLPEIEEYLHYRSVDVSSIKELVRRWYPEVLTQRGWKQGAHRALDDIRESISELRLYRSLVFNAPDEVAKRLEQLNAAVAEPEPEPEPEAEPQPTLQEQLQLAADLTGTETALTALFDLWGLEYRSGQGTGCAQADAAGYACFYQRGSWSGLRQLDRPAILTLTDADGNTHQVVLTQILGDVAELSIAGVKVTHPIGDISELWFGQFLLIWRPPNGEVVSLRVGSQNNNVTWLRQSLASIDDRYRAEPVDSDYYDDELADRVRDFQRDKRIDVDGLAGQQTQIIINSLLAIEGTPRLITPRLARD